MFALLLSYLVNGDNIYLRLIGVKNGHDLKNNVPTNTFHLTSMALLAKSWIIDFKQTYTTLITIIIISCLSTFENGLK